MTLAPLRTVCAWCQRVLADVPQDARGVSHGICEGCVVTFTASASAPAVATRPAIGRVA